MSTFDLSSFPINVYFLSNGNLTGPSPVRNLKCYFDRQDGDKIKCSWDEPELPNGLVRFYHIHLLHLGKHIYTSQTPNKRIEISVELLDGGNYEVGVNTVTNSWSAIASSLLKYRRLSKSSFLSQRLKCYLLIIYKIMPKSIWVH